MLANIISVEEEAENFQLVTLRDAKLALNIPESSTSSDAQLELLIKWCSEEIAIMCNRNFAQESVTERFSDFDNAPRLFLSYAPVKEIVSVTDDDVVIDPADYVVDVRNGILSMEWWSGATVIQYTGGYDLPFKTPPGLSQAALLMVKEAYYGAIRGDASIRMVAHKESRVMYFDPNAAAAKAGGSGSGGSPARKAIDRLLMRYTRFFI
jgi:hypothetical protein